MILGTTLSKLGLLPVDNVSYLFLGQTSVVLNGSCGIRTVGQRVTSLHYHIS